MTYHQEGSAKIYQFPVKFRAAAGGQREAIEPAAHGDAPQVAIATGGGAWYHDEAIQEAQRSSGGRRFPRP